MVQVKARDWIRYRPKYRTTCTTEVQFVAIRNALIDAGLIISSYPFGDRFVIESNDPRSVDYGLQSNG